MSTPAGGRAMVITIGPRHDLPWWWEQLDRSPLRDSLVYERISLGDKGHQQLGLRQIPALIGRLSSLLRRARREKISHVVTFESDLSCYLIGLLQLLPGFAGPRHVIVQFISREANASFSSKCKDFAARVCLHTVHRVVCSSRREARYYRERFGWSPSKAVYVPLHSDRRLLERPPRPPEDFIIAAGRSYRDYATLAQAVAGTGIRTIIVCGRGGPGLSSLPPEIEVLSEIPLAELSNKIAASRALVLPLEDRRISTGQSVLLHAMSLGKPVITTLTTGTEDYLTHGQNGLYVPPRDPEALAAAIRKVWDDPSFADKLGRTAKTDVANNYLPLHYLHAVARELGCTARGVV